MTKKEKENPIFRKTAVALGVALMFGAGAAMAQGTAVPVNPANLTPFIGTAVSGTYTANPAPVGGNPPVEGDYWEIAPDDDGLIPGDITDPGSDAVYVDVGGNLVLKSSGVSVIVEVTGEATDGGNHGAGEQTAALAVRGNLTVGAKGELKSTGGAVDAAIGTYVAGNLIVETGGTVTAAGSETGEFSTGIVVGGGIEQTGGTITVTGGGSTQAAGVADIEGAGGMFVINGMLQEGDADTVLKTKGGSEGDGLVLGGGVFGGGTFTGGLTQKGEGKIEAEGTDQSTGHADRAGKGLVILEGNLEQDAKAGAEILAKGGAKDAGAGGGAVGIQITYGDLVQTAGNLGEIKAEGGDGAGAYGIELVGAKMPIPPGTPAGHGNLTQRGGLIEATGGEGDDATGIILRRAGAVLTQYEGGVIVAIGGPGARADGIFVTGTAGENAVVQQGGTIYAEGDVGFGLLINAGSLQQNAAGTINATGGETDNTAGIGINNGNLVTAGTIKATGTSSNSTSPGIAIGTTSTGGILDQREGGVIHATGGSTNAGAYGIKIFSTAFDTVNTVAGKVYANYDEDTGLVTNSAASGILIERGSLTQNGENSEIYARGGKNAFAHGIELADGGLTQTQGLIKAWGSDSVAAHGIRLTHATRGILTQTANGVIEATGGVASQAVGIWVQGSVTAAGQIIAEGGTGNQSDGIHIVTGALSQTGGLIAAEGGANRGHGINIVAGGLAQTGGTIYAGGGSDTAAGISVATTLTQSGAGSVIVAEGGGSDSHGIIVGTSLTQNAGKIQAEGGMARSSGIAIVAGPLNQTGGDIYAKAGGGANAHGISVFNGGLSQTGGTIEAVGGATTQHGISVVGNSTIGGELIVSTTGNASALHVDGTLTVNSGAVIGVSLVDSRLDKALITVTGNANVSETAIVDIRDFDAEEGDVRTVIAADSLTPEVSDILFRVGGVAVTPTSMFQFAIDEDAPDGELRVVYAGDNWDEEGPNVIDIATDLTWRKDLEGDADTSLTKSGGGTLTLKGTNTYQGGTIIADGTVSIERNANIGTAASGNENIIGRGAALELTGDGTYTHDWTLGTIGPSTFEPVIAVADGVTATVTGALSGESLEKGGAGVLILGGENTYTGDTTIAAGTLSIDSDSRLGAASGTNYIMDGATLKLTGEQYSRGWMLVSGSAAIEVDGATTMGGALTGLGSLVKEGSGTLTLTNTGNNYSGDTFILDGTLSISSQSNIGGTGIANIIIDDATLQLTNEGVATFDRGIVINEDAIALIEVTNAEGEARFTVGLEGGGDLVKGGEGTLVLGGENTDYSGDITVAAGTLDIAGGLGIDEGAGVYRYDGTILVLDPGSKLVLSANVANQIFAGETIKAPNAAVDFTRNGTTKTLSGDGRHDIGTATIFSGVTLAVDRNLRGTENVGSTHIGDLVMVGGSTLNAVSASNLSIDKANVHHTNTLVKDEVGNNVPSTIRIGANNTLDMAEKSITFHLNALSPEAALPVLAIDTTAAGARINLSDTALLITGLEEGEEVSLISYNEDDVIGNPLRRATGEIDGTQLVRSVSVLEYDDVTRILSATGQRPEATEKAKTLAEGYVTGVALVNQGADIVAGLAMSNAVEAASTGGNAFAAIQGGRNKYDVGSRTELDSVSMLVGAANGWAVSDNNRLTVGGFIEYGTGSYDTEQSFANGDGNTYYYGIGALGRMDIGKAYVEGSLRLGQVKNKNDALLDRGTVSYNASSMYYGVHIGAGYILSLSEKSALDLYGKYLWSGVGSETTDVRNDLAENVHFSGVNSHRTRLGGRYIYQATQATSMYAGLAWEHEFDAKAKSTVNFRGAGYDVAVPDLKGSSAMLEAGVRFTPSDSTPLYIDLGLTGYMGKRDGIMGNLRVNYRF